jgi:CRP/FNR family transcriptional regulator
MDGHSEAIRFLKSLTHFAGLPSATMKTIASRCRLKSRQAGENLFLEGDPCRDLYILVSGRVKCLRVSSEGREQILKIFERPGDMFCTTSAFSTGSHIVTAETMNDVSLYVVDVETIKRAAVAEPAVALALVTAAGDQMRSLVSLADDLSLKTATARVAKLLWERARAEGGRNRGAIRLQRSGLREDEIAAMVGTVRVHVSRSLKALATMGAITLDRETIGISDLKALEGFLRALEHES